MWRADAIVLFHWPMTTDLNEVPITHPAQKQALADLLTRMEETNAAVFTAQELAQAQEAVARDMGW